MCFVFGHASRPHLISSAWLLVTLWMSCVEKALIWFTSPCATGSLFLFSCYAPVDISVSSQSSWVKDWRLVLELTVASNLSSCVFRCGVWRQDDHYRWKTDQTADLGHGKMSLMPLCDDVNVNVPVLCLNIYGNVLIWLPMTWLKEYCWCLQWWNTVALLPLKGRICTRLQSPASTSTPLYCQWGDCCFYEQHLHWFYHYKYFDCSCSITTRALDGSATHYKQV